MFETGILVPGLSSINQCITNFQDMLISSSSYFPGYTFNFRYLFNNTKGIIKKIHATFIALCINSKTLLKQCSYKNTNAEKIISRAVYNRIIFLKSFI